MPSNRLGLEASPYLRQHADNPVGWYPWGPEAFARAVAEDKPILLSVGYSACHWCHVMAHESFEDDEVAGVMNDLFVNVKVDREERPDVDSVYMDAVQAMSGHGGWPMTVFLAPDGRPFWGGTYVPKVRFLQLMEAIDDAWRDRRPELLGHAEEITQALGRTAGLQAGQEVPGVEALNAALGQLAQAFDPDWGGFGAAPKFPQAMNLELCLRVFAEQPGDGARQVLETSLDAMASGGIYDHLGGGFARYSVDATWTVPHFEKMLYDQALLARVYLHAWQALGHPRYRQVLDEVVGYLLRDLRQPGGGFASAEDADSEGVEGRFYVWNPTELVEVLGPELAGVAAEWWGVTEAGNFEGTTILTRPVRGDLLRPPAVEEARQRLLAARGGRVRPGLDDKVLTEWNALVVATLAEAAAATGEVAWRDAAVAAGEFLLRELRIDGRWHRSWQAQVGARHLAYAADHAALVDAFTRLAELTGEARWIDEARSTARSMLDLFWDDAEGGLFTVGSDAEQLVARQKDLLDNATPAANSLAAVALLRLGALTGDDELTERALGILRLVGRLAATHPTAFGHLLGAVDLLRRGIDEVAVVGDRPDLVDVVRQAYRPSVVLAWGEPYASPLWEHRHDGLAYVCRHYACQAPTGDAAALREQLAGA